MENDNGATKKPQLFRDMDFMLLAVSMANQVIGDIVSEIEVDYNDNGRIIGQIYRKGSMDNYLFEARPHFVPGEVIWSRYWDLAIYDVYCNRSRCVKVPLSKHTVAWIKATVSIL